MFVKRLVVLMAAVLTLGLLAVPATAAPTAQVSAKCSTSGKFPPASYVTGIKASGVSCTKARKVVKAYHKCRGSKAGKCKRKVLGFKCKDGKRHAVPGVQYSTTAKCVMGGKRVVSSYTQNL